MSPEIAAITLLFAVHLLGAAILIAGMLDGETDPWGWWPGRRRDAGPPPPPPPPRRGPDGVPLPDAEQSRRRLRGPGRIAPDRAHRRARPDREPAPEPAPGGAEAPSGGRDAAPSALGYYCSSDGQNLSQLREGPRLRQQPKPFDGGDQASL